MEVVVKLAALVNRVHRIENEVDGLVEATRLLPSRIRSAVDRAFAETYDSASNPATDFQFPLHEVDVDERSRVVYAGRPSTAIGRLKRLQSPKTRYRPDVILTDVRLERAASAGVVVTSKGGRQVSRF
jgi:hypothetical protein